jgi:hypothetical protein
MKKREPHWKDGEPADLVGAAVDALNWLQWIDAKITLYPTEGRVTLHRAIAALEKHLPEEVRE